MATKVTERAREIARGVIAANGYRYVVYHDAQVGQRVGARYPDRYWLLLTGPDGRTVNQSTTKQAVAEDWLALIRDNGTPA